MSSCSVVIKKKIVQIFEEFRKSNVIGLKRFYGEFKLGRISNFNLF